MWWKIVGILVAASVLFPLGALAQRPGYLGKPPAHKPGAAHRVGTLPKWPRRPDPKPLVTRHYLEIEVQLRQNALRVEKVTKGSFAKPTAIPRFRGRFEVQLYAHGLLRDVVRFDLPLTGGADSGAGGGSGLGDRFGLELSKGVTGKTVVRIPFDKSVNRVLIHDTLTRKTVTVDLSPVLPKQPKPKPENLRTRSFGSGLEDAKVLKGAGTVPAKKRPTPKKPAATGKQPPKK